MSVGSDESEAEEILQRIDESFSPQCVIGASAEGVIGKDKEVEREAGLAVLAGDVGGALVKSFNFGRDDWRDDEAEQRGSEGRSACHARAPEGEEFCSLCRYSGRGRGVVLSVDGLSKSEITLTLALPRSTGRGDRRDIGLGLRLLDLGPACAGRHDIAMRIERDRRPVGPEAMAHDQVGDALHAVAAQ